MPSEIPGWNSPEIPSLDEALLIDVHRLARLCSFSARTAAKFVKEGKIPSVKIGGRRLFRVEAIRQWLKAHEDGGPG